MSTNRKIFLFVALPLVIVFITLFAYYMSRGVGRSNTPVAQTNETNPPAQSSTASTQSCSNLQTPVDITQVTAVLYPGQYRGGQYKPHGGFRFDKATSNAVEVKAPLAADVIDGSRYIEQGEVQYLFDFKTDCGLEYRFDHIKTLSAKLQAAAEKLPSAKADDSRTTQVNGVSVDAGEVIANEVGFANNGQPNVSVDFGLYDRQEKNQASKDSAYVAKHQGEGDQAFYAVCWLSYLPSADATTLKALPAGDQTSGKQSDYCKE